MDSLWQHFLFWSAMIAAITGSLMLEGTGRRIQPRQVVGIGLMTGATVGFWLAMRNINS